MKKFEDAKLFVTMVASQQGWELNRDQEHLEILIEGFAKNYNRYGYYSCPCRAASGKKDEDRDIVCPCRYCRPDQEEYGHCFCGLYLTKEYFATGEEPASIPERRKV